MQIIVGADVRCPCCGRDEVDDNTLPVDQWAWNIRAYRVDDWSECLHCKVWFNPDNHVEVSEKTDTAIREKLGFDRIGVYQVTYA